MEHFIEPSGAVKHSFIEDCHRLGQLIYWHKQGNYSIQVRQLNQLRWLLINETLQSVIEKRRPARLLFPHLQYLAKLWQDLEEPKKILELGLGGGAIRNYLQHTYPDSQLTSVDKNPDIIHCYKRYFGGDHANNLHCFDAQQVLEQNNEYNWIILDLFSEVDAPLFLYKHLFYTKLRAAMTKDGLLFINFLSNHPSQLKQLEHLLITEFGKRPSIVKIPDYVNHIVMIKK
ncbi:SAM-dependent methyltransferase [Pseudoalteromonas sp. BZK2]|uniref:spermidine synthase n=1 Tax=Pseudoalteromonas sp. BZK2 TaxID=1904458 RepID=UPI001654B001|nr:SAM-dependent methyltransferase [Pseudoalteromonas sp. BZK2]MBC7007403.1 SAM-dependent methyltransferase [Pseudoalteromonas sp. BZK2]